MAPRGERDDRIRDAVRQIGLLDYTESDLRKYLGAEMGALNIKQNEGVIALVQVVRGILLALAALNNEMKMIFENGEIVLAMGDASIRMKRDGTIDIKGNDIRVKASGALNISGSKDVTIKSGKEVHVQGIEPAQ